MMGTHPLNLALRFLLELAALFSFGAWGWGLDEGWQRFIFAISVPLIAALTWGIFAVPDDPSRSGNAPIPVPGIVRLLIELGIFSFATWSYIVTGHPALGWLFGFIVFVHYALSYDRILWLIKR